MVKTRTTDNKGTGSHNTSARPTTPGQPRTSTTGQPRSTTQGHPQPSTPGQPRTSTTDQPRFTSQGEPQSSTPGQPKSSAPGQSRSSITNHPIKTVQSTASVQPISPGQPTTPDQPTTPGQPTIQGQTTTPGQPVTQCQSSTPGQPTLSPLSILSTLEDDISSLSEEGKTIVNTIIKAVQAISEKKDQVINKLQDQVTLLENKVYDLENQIDDVNQYERRDTIIVSGASLPKETSNENTTEVFINAIKDNLKINISQTDINVAHRLGNNNRQNANKPIIVKLQSRLMKQEITNACITMRPSLHINESLTPRRLALFKTIWSIRKNNRDLFQQCYTKDGKIHIKLKCSNQKHIITNEQHLNSFLDKFPAFRDS